MMKKLKDYQIRSLKSLKTYFSNCNSYKDASLAFYKTTEELFGDGLPYTKIGGLEDVPYICLRMPTGAGKTMMACHSIKIAGGELLQSETPVVVWLVPSNQIKTQTLICLKDTNHDYRQILDANFSEVNVYDISEARNIRRSVLDRSLTIIVSTLQALRIDDTDGRKVYESCGDLMEHFSNVPNDLLNRIEKGEGGIYKKSLANLLYLRRPIFIVDEAHNARTDLSFDVLARFNPSCIIEFTATPNATNCPSNVLHSTSAAELKSENMIKVPILIETKNNWKEIVSLAVGRLNALSKMADIEQQNTGEYIRPIMLLQAESDRVGKECITTTVIKDYLINTMRVPEEEIAIETGAVKELNNIDILSPLCKIKYVITIQALREGWDCPFAYVLCSVADMRSSTAIEQIVGRIMRMPKGEKKVMDGLEQAYVYVSSNDFFDVVRSLEEALIQNGFQKTDAKDYITKLNEEPQQSELLFENNDATNEVSYSELGFASIGISESPDLTKITTYIQQKVVFDQTNKTITVYGKLSESEFEELSDCFQSEQSKDLINRLKTTLESREERVVKKCPFRQGLEFKVPALSEIKNEQLQLFEESSFLDKSWNILSYDCKLSDSQYSINNSTVKTGEINIANDGKISSRFIGELQEQIKLFSNIDTGWTVPDLAIWLDQNIKHTDISTLKSIPYITKILQNLISAREFSVNDLVVDRYNLKLAIERKINDVRAAEMKKAYQLSIFDDSAKVTVSPKLYFDLSTNGYPASYYYQGSFEFQNHYFEHVGELKSTGEEFECAQYIDTMECVVYWIRNLERKQGSFWLQTSTDKFYPDFICLLKSGQYLVVEYKGADRISNDDSKEKKALGEIWERLSDGRCLFLMISDKNYSEINSKIKQALKSVK